MMDYHLYYQDGSHYNEDDSKNKNNDNDNDNDNTTGSTNVGGSSSSLTPWRMHKSKTAPPPVTSSFSSASNGSMMSSSSTLSRTQNDDDDKNNNNIQDNNRTGSFRVTARTAAFNTHDSQLLVSSNHHQHNHKSNGNSSHATTVVTAQAEADRRRQDPQTYLTDIMSGNVKNLTQVTEFMSDFNKNIHAYENDFRQRHVQEYKSDLLLHYQTMVPSEVTHKQFLQRYFFRCGSLERIQDDLDRQEAEQEQAQRQRQDALQRQREDRQKQLLEEARQQQEKLDQERLKWGLRPSSITHGLLSSSSHHRCSSSNNNNNNNNKSENSGDNDGMDKTSTSTTTTATNTTNTTTNKNAAVDAGRGSTNGSSRDVSGRSTRSGGGGGGGGGVQFRGVSKDDPSKRAAWDSSEGADINLKSLQPPTLIQRQATNDFTPTQQQDGSVSYLPTTEFLKPVLRRFRSFNAITSNQQPLSSTAATTTTTKSTTDTTAAAVVDTADQPPSSSLSLSGTIRPSWNDAGSRNSSQTAPMTKPQRQVTGSGPLPSVTAVTGSSMSSSSGGSLVDDFGDDENKSFVDNNRRIAMRHMNIASSSSSTSVMSAPLHGASSTNQVVGRPSSTYTTNVTIRSTTNNNNNNNRPLSGPPVTRRPRDLNVQQPIRRNSARDLISKLESQSNHNGDRRHPAPSSSSSLAPVRSLNTDSVAERQYQLRRTSSFDAVTSKNATAMFGSKLASSSRQGTTTSSENTSVTNSLPTPAPATATPELYTRRPLNRSSSFQYKGKGGASQTSETSSTAQKKPGPVGAPDNQNNSTYLYRPKVQIPNSSSSLVSAAVVSAPATELIVTTRPPVSLTTSTRPSRFSSASSGVVSSRLQGMYRNRGNRVRSSSVTPSITRGIRADGVAGDGDRIAVGRSSRQVELQKCTTSVTAMTAPVNTTGAGTGIDVASVAASSFASLNHTVGGNGGTQAHPLAVKSVLRANRRRQAVETYTIPLEDHQNEDQDIKNYLESFQMDKFQDAAAIALALYPESVAIHHQDLVVHPDDDLDAVNESDFWCRYFFRCDEQRILNDLRQKDKLGILGESSRNLFAGWLASERGASATSPIGMRIPMRISSKSTLDKSSNNILTAAEDNDSTQATKNTGTAKPRVGSLKEKLAQWTKVTSNAAAGGGSGASAVANNKVAEMPTAPSRVSTPLVPAADRARRYRGRPISSGGSAVSAPIRSQSLSYTTQKAPGR